jgi:NAD+ kinase
MNNFLIITNQAKDPDLTIANRIKECFLEADDNTKVEFAKVERVEGKFRFTNPENVSDDVECVITVGGDGTLLQAARDLGKLKIPFIGINRGTLGYLSEVSTDGLQSMADKLIHNDFSVEKRMMLEGKVVRDGKEICQSIALNDIIISRVAGMVDLSINVNGKYLATYFADGIIVSTPTGSTAYNLSAGGPIIEPSAEIILITPVCPHTISARPLILSEQDEISIKIGNIRGNTRIAVVSYDGDMVLELKEEDTITINKSKQTTEIIKLSDQSFIEVLKVKMGDR